MHNACFSHVMGMNKASVASSAPLDDEREAGRVRALHQGLTKAISQHCTSQQQDYRPHPHKPVASEHLTRIPSEGRQIVNQHCAPSAHLSVASASAYAPRPSETQTPTLSRNKHHVAELPAVQREPVRPSRGRIWPVCPGKSIRRRRLWIVEPLRRRSKQCDARHD
jgi:hypothetical protein